MIEDWNLDKIFCRQSKPIRKNTKMSGKTLFSEDSRKILQNVP